MRAWMAWGGLTAVATIGAALLGCSVDARSTPPSGGAVAYSAPTATASTTPAPASGQPLLVEVDPNRTLTASAGQGIGVFTEYTSGGHWHVWWTCDTSATELSCSFDVKVSVTTGSIANASATLLDSGNFALQPNGQSFEATTTTTSVIAGVTFDTTPGAVITLSAQVNGLSDGAFLFFVQDGQVNGGYAGTVTDPLMLEPSSP